MGAGPRRCRVDFTFSLGLRLVRRADRLPFFELPSVINATAPQHPLANELQRGLAGLGLELPAATQAQLLRYLDLIAHWSRVYNLTAVREPAAMLTQHLLDCLAIITPLRRQMVEVGVGAGGGPPPPGGGGRRPAPAPRGGGWGGGHGGGGVPAGPGGPQRQR
ncbi:RsmG family class I SAM-dependent methyltransferase, partial [Ideonella sp.]|uniref:RsmG family class I SAM-dependent methyltransferase n=1 Tax=Ideonella sp. TaxID=1929293 RepID=UPI0035B3ACFD